MPSTMSLRGYVFDDAGTAKSGVEIKVFEKNTTSPALTTDPATVTTDGDGLWTAQFDPSDSDETQVDVQGRLGSSVFRWKYDDKIAVSKATIGDLILTPTHNFSFIFIGNPASADVTVRLPDASADDAYTLAGLSVAQTFSAAQTFTSTVTVGSDGSGTDVIFYSGTSGDNLTWDASEEQLIITGTNGTTSLNVADGNVAIADDLAVDGTSNLDNTDIDGTLAVDGATISLDATTSLNIDNSNTSNGVTIGTATSGMPVSIGHATSETTINDNLTVTGTAKVSAGIEFPGEQAEIANVNTLDDYEEATFTPKLGDGTSELSSGYNLQVGEYTKIGNRVFFNIHIRNTDLSGLSPSAQLRIVGLPFTAAATVGRAGVAIGAGGSMALDAANQTPAGAVIENTDFINFGVWDATLGLTDMKVSELSDAGVLALSGNYRVAT